MSGYLLKEAGPGRRLAISRTIDGRSICLIQNSYLDEESDATIILEALDIEPTGGNLDHYFPRLDRGRRSPTLELMELCNCLEPTLEGIVGRKEVGV